MSEENHFLKCVCPRYKVNKNIENSSKESNNVIKIIKENSPEVLSIPKKEFRGKPPRLTTGALSLPKKEVKTELKTPNFPKKKFRGRAEQIANISPKQLKYSESSTSQKHIKTEEEEEEEDRLIRGVFGSKLAENVKGSTNYLC
ncbi:hypothetical protein Mgra_00008118 [Meloidogyne graminicola]|uniref:Uncharacterized protein n=1 Tax=Meloidogyne graminicola TaxID=189291 RepID=A0A8S9ZH08_9BILA|nr:hypothetical protein Mgra_00008118 [Meloidogyne graminicola]